MKLNVLNITKTELRKKELPTQFNEEIRPDIIKRAVIALQSSRRQRYGADPEAGKRASAELSKRRHNYRSSYGYGISRVPRKILSRRGTRMVWVGAFAPGTVGGRRAHPPKAEKRWELKINKKERRKAIRSAISATVITDLVKARGHIVPSHYPFIIENKIEELDKTKDVKKILEKLGLEEELKRVSKKKVRAGKGKSRGRKYKKIRGILFVVSKNCNLLKSAKNIPGLEVEAVNNLNVEILAPGTNMGRLTIFTEESIERLEKERLFTDNPIIQEEKEIKKDKVKREKKEPKEKTTAKKKVVKKEERIKKKEKKNM